MAASSSSAAQAASLVKEAVELGLLPEENNYTASGYAGVTEVKGKYQARVFDRRRKRQRAIPGLHATALQAALALARAKQLLLDEGDEGWTIPSPPKRKSRRPTPILPIAMAIPLDAVSPRLPLLSVQPSSNEPCAGMALPVPAAAMAAACGMPVARVEGPGSTGSAWDDPHM